MHRMGMPSSEITTAEILKARGYHTIHLGNWYLGEAAGMRPEDQGFDESFGFMPGASKYEADTASINARLPGDPLDRLLSGSGFRTACSSMAGGHFTPANMTDYLSDQAVAAIRANRSRPFFIYLAYNAPHTPFQAARSDYEALSSIKDARLRVYGAMIRALDRGVGKVLASLQSQGLAENTLVIFTNDNGGAWYAGLADINKPYRGWKGTFFEGGIRAPFFIRWPARIPAGQRVGMPTEQIDVLPTLAAAAGARLPAGRQIDGLDLLPIVAAKPQVPVKRTLFWRSGGYEAVRDGDWKLQLSRNPLRIWLFDLATDPTERVDLSSRRPNAIADLRGEPAAHDRQLAKPLWPALLEEPIRIDVPADAPWRLGQEYVYWPN